MDQFLRAHGDGGAESALASAGNAGRVAVGCLWDTWNPGSSLDLGSLLRKPQPREGKAAAQGHTVGLEPSSPGIPQSTVPSTAPP